MRQARTGWRIPAVLVTLLLALITGGGPAAGADRSGPSATGFDRGSFALSAIVANASSAATAPPTSELKVKRDHRQTPLFATIAPASYRAHRPRGDEPSIATRPIRAAGPPALRGRAPPVLPA